MPSEALRDLWAMRQAGERGHVCLGGNWDAQAGGAYRLLNPPVQRDDFDVLEGARQTVTEMDADAIGILKVVQMARQTGDSIAGFQEYRSGLSGP